MLDTDIRRNGIPMRKLGSTGELVTILGIGGYHVGSAGEAVGVRIVRTAIDEGVNFLDNAWCYHDGRSEEIMGKALADGYRDKIFLMTKNHGRTAHTFTTQLDDSLRRLGTDHLDLIQFHDIDSRDVPPQMVDEGAFEAATGALESGKVRFVGFTGHTDPIVHCLMLDQDFPWDTVQLPINLLDLHHRSFIRHVVPELLSRRIGVIGMKSLASGRLLDTGVAPREALRFALSQPISVLVSGMDSMKVLRENLEVARSFEPMSDAEMQRLVCRVAPYAADGHLETYKR